MAVYCYEREPYRRELDTEVMEVGREEGRDGGRNWVVLADTIFYPEGGGQPADRGTIGAANVLDVQSVDGIVRHTLSASCEPGPVRLVLDWERRYDHMQQHTAQHLLTAVAAESFGLETLAFHLGEATCDIEVDRADLSRGDLERLEAAVAMEIRAARPVTARSVAPEEVAGLDRLRSRGLPAGHSGPVRLVEIEGLDLNTCGGTHVSSTAEIESLKLLDTEPMRGGLRLHWVAGARVRARLGSLERRIQSLRSLFETSEEELLEVAGLKLDQLRETARRSRHLARSLAELEGAALASSEERERVTLRHFEDVDADFLQSVARSYLDRQPSTSRVALLTGSGDRGGFFVIACPDPAIDLGALGPRVAQRLKGRGGGRGPIYQGRAADVGRRREAADILESALETPSPAE